MSEVFQEEDNPHTADHADDQGQQQVHCYPGLAGLEGTEAFNDPRLTGLVSSVMLFSFNLSIKAS
ncbi:MAG: hypothetical protein R2864_12680 [Syntrophotaleaceae bacterium]